MLTPMGVKLLDFGLAKLSVSIAASSQTTLNVDSRLATDGRIRGTLPYMAPELFESRDADARSDLFALGATIFEMAVGRPVFTANSASGLVAAITERHSESPAAMTRLTPAALDPVVRKCLAKDPSDRWQTAAEILRELRAITADLTSTAAAIPVRRRRRVRQLTALAAVLMLSAAAGAPLPRQSRTVRADAPDLRHQQATFTGDVFLSAISPDGRSVAYATGDMDRQPSVWVRPLDGGPATAIWTGRAVRGLTWLPQGSYLAISGLDEEAGIRIVSLAGGDARRLPGASWWWVAAAPDGGALAATLPSFIGFDVLSLGDETIRRVHLTGFLSPKALDWHARTNRLILLASDQDEVISIWSVGPDGSDQSLLHRERGIRAICASPVTDVVYALRDRGATMMMDLIRVPIHADAGEPPGVLVNGLPFGKMVYRCTVSADGRRLLYGREASQSRLVRLELTKSANGAIPLLQGTQQLWAPAVSPDGKWLAASMSGSEAGAEIVIIPRVVRRAFAECGSRRS